MRVPANPGSKVLEINDLHPMLAASQIAKLRIRLMTEHPIHPFRWNLAQRSQLGALAVGEVADVPADYYSDLRDVSAKIVARSDNSDLVFVGRSPEHIFDYLSGAFARLNNAPVLTLLQFSKSHAGAYRRPLHSPDEFNHVERAAFLSYLQAEAIDPLSLASSDRPLRFVDMVSSGATFIMLLAMFRELTKQQGADWNVVSKRLGFLGVTYRTKNSPNTFRWQQSQYWLDAGGGLISTKNISTPWSFWGHAANVAEKVTPSFHRRRWFDPQFARPQHSDDALKALRRSVEIYDLATGREERGLLAQKLATLHEFKEPWVRELALRLKGR